MTFYRSFLRILRSSKSGVCSLVYLALCIYYRMVHYFLVSYKFQALREKYQYWGLQIVSNSELFDQNLWE
jgi:hypothetical protein